MNAKEQIALLQKRLDAGEIHPDEPLFVLRGQDTVAAATVKHWVRLAAALKASPEKVAGAKQIAADIAAWPIKQIPGRPDTRVDRSNGFPVTKSE